MKREYEFKYESTGMVYELRATHENGTVKVSYLDEDCLEHSAGPAIDDSGYIRNVLAGELINSLKR